MGLAHHMVGHRHRDWCLRRCDRSGSPGSRNRPNPCIDDLRRAPAANDERMQVTQVRFEGIDRRISEIGGRISWTGVRISALTCRVVRLASGLTERFDANRSATRMAEAPPGRGESCETGGTPAISRSCKSEFPPPESPVPQFETDCIGRKHSPRSKELYSWNEDAVATSAATCPAFGQSRPARVLRDAVRSSARHYVRTSWRNRAICAVGTV